MPLSDDADGGVHQGVLRAFNADNLTQELWDSNQNQVRDSMGNWPKFSAPLVANGRVYIGSYPEDGISNTTISVYGLLPVAAYASSSTAGIKPGSPANYNINVVSPVGFSGLVNFSVSGLPLPGAAASITSGSVSQPATINITTSAQTPLGTYFLTITGTGGPVQTPTNVVLDVTTQPGKGAISIDFVGGGSSMAATEIAGVVPRANWNKAIGAASGEPLALIDETGSVTSATVSWMPPVFGPSPSKTRRAMCA